MKNCTRVLVFVFVMMQIAVPARYYLFETDPFNEDYAWRMFSSTSLAAARVEWMRSDGHAYTALTRADLDNAGMSSAWTRLAFGSGNFGRSAPSLWVLDRLAEQLCTRLPASPKIISVRRIYAPLRGDPVVEEPMHLFCQE